MSMNWRAIGHEDPQSQLGLTGDRRKTERAPGLDPAGLPRTCDGANRFHMHPGDTRPCVGADGRHPLL